MDAIKGVMNHPQPDMVADGFCVLFCEKIVVTPEISNAMRAHQDPVRFAQAIIVLSKGENLSAENLAVISVHSNPAHLAVCLNHLQKQIKKIPAIRTAIATHPDFSVLVDGILALDAGGVLTAATLADVEKAPDPQQRGIYLGMMATNTALGQEIHQTIQAQDPALAANIKPEELTQAFNRADEQSSQMISAEFNRWRKQKSSAQDEQKSAPVLARFHLLPPSAAVPQEAVQHEPAAGMLDCVINVCKMQ